MNAETSLVTGASSNIGRELARCFAADGCRLVLLGRKRQAIQALAAEFRATYKTNSEVLPADLSDPPRAKAELDELAKAEDGESKPKKKCAGVVTIIPGETKL